MFSLTPARIRSLATPLTIGAFALLSVTGVLMFFHLDQGWNKLAHEWLSWALLAGAGLHVFVNWSAFKQYLKRPLGLGIILLFVAALGLSFLGPKGGGSPVRAVMASISEAPLAALAPLAKKTPDELASGLKEVGLTVTNPATDTLLSLAGNDREKVKGLLERVFAP